VFRSALPLGLGALCWLALVAAAPAQDEAPKKKQPPPPKSPEDVTEDYRNFFNKPTTPLEFWKAVQFEIDVGRYDLAARQLHGLIDKKPEDKDLLAILDREGMSAFLRLRTIRTWSKVPAENAQAKTDVETLIGMVTAAQKRLLTDPDRLGRLVRNLNGEPEERDYAVQELYRSGAYAVPFLVDALKDADPDDRANILFALKRMGADAVPAILAATENPDPIVQAELIDAVRDRARTQQIYNPLTKKVETRTRSDLPLLRQRAETDPSPWWFALTHSPSDAVRRAALRGLSDLFGVQPALLPQAKQELTATAERYYQHKVRFLDPGHVTVWRWDGKRLVAGWPGATTVTTSQAEQYYGLHFARAALAIDPSYRPAQVVFLSLALEKGVERSGLDGSLDKGAPEVKNLVDRVNPGLVVAVLERALNDGVQPVILGALRELGDLADSRAALPTGERGESPLVRALYFPERRIQMAAAVALLRLPRPTAPPNTPRAGQPAAPVAPARTVEVLRRMAAAEPVAAGKPKVLVAFEKEDVTTPASQALEKAGFVPVVAHTGRDVLRRLNAAADIDLLLIDAGLPDPGLASLLGQLRSDANTGLLPVVVLVPPDREGRVRLLTDHYRNVNVAPQGLALDPDGLKRILPVLIIEAVGPPLDGSQLRAYGEQALTWLARMAKGEAAGYDIRPAAETVLDVLRAGRLSKEGQLAAIEVAGHLPGARPQRELAEVVIDPSRDPAVRAAAGRQLVRQIEQRGPALAASEVAALQGVYADGRIAPAVRDQVALVLGTLRPSARTTGERLESFQPPPPTPPAVKEEKTAKPEKEEKKGPEKPEKDKE
jgi:CheY-like chemotaxis protein